MIFFQVVEAVFVFGPLRGLEVSVGSVVADLGLAALVEVDEGKQAIGDALLVENQRVLESQVDGKDYTHDAAPFFL
jgi:hypothetical protein